jgi:hypothetical protein
LKLSSKSWKILGVLLIAPVVVIVIALDFNRSLNNAKERVSPVLEDENKTIQFERIVIDSTFTGGYQVKSADLNGDDLPDLIAVSTSMQEIYWYENPSWQKHLVYEDTRANIDLAPNDIDNDGDIDLALASQFSLGNSISGGHVSWLENIDLGASWKLHFIDSIPTSHRLRWADLDGDSRADLINLPIIGRGASKPTYQAGVEFCYYTIPRNPGTESWPKVAINHELEMAHGLQLVKWGDEKSWSILTASFGGVDLFQPQGNGEKWEMTKLGSGDIHPRPKQGSSEVGLGRLDRGKPPFIATIEPWHGNQVVFYSPGEEGELWKREVIDTTFVDGHALLCADLNGNGTDEIIAGYRGGGHNLYIYQWIAAANQWQRHDLDPGGMSAAGLCLLDFNADGFIDIAACGSATHNVMLYENLGN